MASKRERRTTLTVAQRRELTQARDCADAGIQYYNLNGYKRQMLRRLVDMGYLKRISGGVNVCEITDAGRAALAADTNDTNDTKASER